MAKLIVHYESGEPDRMIEFDPRKAPFQHDGEPASILDVLLGHGAYLEHACGGVLRVHDVPRRREGKVGTR